MDFFIYMGFGLTEKIINDDGVGASSLRGTRALADAKAKSCDGKYPAEHPGLACAVAIKFASGAVEAQRAAPRAGGVIEQIESNPIRKRRNLGE